MVSEGVTLAVNQWTRVPADAWGGPTASRTPLLLNDAELWAEMETSLPWGDEPLRGIRFNASTARFAGRSSADGVGGSWGHREGAAL